MKSFIRMLALIIILLTIAGCAMIKETFVPPKALSGLDAMAKNDFAQLKGKNIGLVTNHSSIDYHGRSMLELMHGSKNIKIVAIFAPEHGFKGTAEHLIENQKEEETGLTIYSLYGNTRRPTEDMLKGIDVLVFDIQDIGARFYTYISTMAMCMEEAVKNNIKVIVLDRPNPIGGIYVDGPIQDEALYGRFTSYFPMPVVHGMTIGELAWMFNEHFGIGCDLEIIKMKRWKRTMYFDETGLPWVNPSPNILNVKEEILYPGFAMTEGANVSMGRGTDTPFEVFGAPYCNAIELTNEMESRNLPGLRFEPFSFVPDKRGFKDKLCNGFKVTITDRDALQIIPVGLHFIDALQKLYPDTYEIDRTWGLLGSRSIIEMIKERKPVEQVIQSYQDELQQFIAVRDKYLIYK